MSTTKATTENGIDNRTLKAATGCMIVVPEAGDVSTMVPRRVRDVCLNVRVTRRRDPGFGQSVVDPSRSAPLQQFATGDGCYRDICNVSLN